MTNRELIESLKTRLSALSLKSKEHKKRRPRDKDWQFHKEANQLEVRVHVLAIAYVRRKQYSSVEVWSGYRSSQPPLARVKGLLAYYGLNGPAMGPNLRAWVLLSVAKKHSDPSHFAHIVDRFGKAGMAN